jgi:hemoglobin
MMSSNSTLLGAGLFFGVCGLLYIQQARMTDEKKPTKKATIYDRIGGKASVNAAVDIFYKKVLSDDRVNKFFKNTDMHVQRAKQAKFLAFVLGAPEQWKGKSMLEAHKGMNITEEQFGAIAGHLQTTLQELGVPADIVGEIMAVAASTHDDIVGR